MEAVAAVIGIADVTIRTSSKLWALCNAWREAPSDLHRLRDDLTRTELFFAETREGLVSTSPQAGLNEKVILLDLKRLLDQGGLVIQEVEDIVDQLWDGTASSPSDVLNARRKLTWLKNATKINKLRKELGTVLSAVCRVLVVQNVTISTELRASLDDVYGGLRSHIDDSVERTSKYVGATVISSEQRIISRIDSSLEDLQVKLTPPSEPLDDKPGSLDRPVRPFPSRPTRCTVTCACECHYLSTFSKVNLTTLRSLLGFLTLTHAGNPTRTCTDKSCQNTRASSATQQTRVFYTLPNWLSRASLYISFSSNLGGGPQFSLRMLNRVSENAAKETLWSIITRGDSVNEAKRLLMTKQATIYDIRDWDCVPPMYSALQFRRIGVFKLLLQAGADPYQMVNYPKVDEKPTPAQKAMELVLSGDPAGKEVSELLPVSQYVEHFDYPMLHKAVMGYLNVDLSGMVTDPQYASSINQRAPDGLTPIELAAIKGDAKACRLLLRAGVDPTSLSAIEALRQACRCGHYEATKALLQGGIPTRPGRGYTPFLLAARSDSGDVRLMPLLNEYGAGITFDSVLAAAALIYATVKGNLNIMRYFLENGANKYQLDPEGDGVIIQAILHNQIEAARLLLENVVQMTTVNVYGRNILHVLAAQGTSEMMDLISTADLMGVGTLARDKWGKTPLQVLITERNVTPGLRKAFENLLDAAEGVEVVGEPDDGEELFFDAVENL
ncbi:hypothetical protein OQA88_9102 [Cercophora sp. LCS_1]